MQKYKCKKCDKIFKQKCHYTNHKNRKTECHKDKFKENDNSVECSYCNILFSSHSNMVRHIKNSCKILKKEEINKKVIYDKLLKLEEENKELKKNMKKLLKQVKSKNKIVNNTTNNINNTNNIDIHDNNLTINNNENNITIVAYGKEELTNIDKEQILKAFNGGYYASVKLTKTVHFNPKHPEYHNVYIPSMKDSYAMVYDGEHWKLVQRDQLIDNMYQDKRDYIEENLEEFKESLSISKLKALKRWLESDEDDDKCIQKIKKDIELLLYNEKKIPLDTRKMIK